MRYVFHHVRHTGVGLIVKATESYFIYLTMSPTPVRLKIDDRVGSDVMAWRHEVVEWVHISTNDVAGCYENTLSIKAAGPMILLFPF